MNKSLAFLSAALVLATPSLASAASTVDLTVKGLITPNACTPAVASGGLVDHGKIASKDLTQNNPTSLPRVTLQFRIGCEGPTSFAIRPIDNRNGTAIDSYSFGLGLVNDTQKLGRFYLTPKNILADSVSAQPIASSDGGNTWYAERNWELNTLWGVGGMDDDSVLISMQNLAMDFEVGGQITRADRLDLSNEVTIDGSATLEVIYL